MLDNEVKVTEKSSSSSMPTLTEAQNESELPTEVLLRILFTMSKQLEKRALAQVLTGKTPSGEKVTYIRMTGVDLDTANGFVLAIREKNAVPIPD